MRLLSEHKLKQIVGGLLPVRRRTRNVTFQKGGIRIDRGPKFIIGD